MRSFFARTLFYTEPRRRVDAPNRARLQNALDFQPTPLYDCFLLASAATSLPGSERRMAAQKKRYDA